MLRHDLDVEFAEAAAVTELSDGALCVHVERFENSRAVQPMDNSKHLLLSTADFALPEHGVVEFSGGEVGARNVNASARDYRDGFAALVVVDMTSGLVFDVGVTSDSVFAIRDAFRCPARVRRTPGPWRIRWRSSRSPRTEFTTARSPLIRQPAPCAGRSTARPSSRRRSTRCPPR